MKTLKISTGELIDSKSLNKIKLKRGDIVSLMKRVP